ncbi:MAG: indolepyruvate oxidoreductase subunit beta family protein [Betaproteobacteria bacterium]|nr:indolepyruvate oxidoreductase subunit beta family protein [Betaproteobacteria bacterium]
MPDAPRERITVAILALGGQGGGVLADWILALANRNGFRAQGTSVPGVAQRTGSTVYYIEMIPLVPGDNRGEPVLALNPVPGDVDVVIASELMEAGRAILRGFVSHERTTLIGSTHRVYAISEKSVPGNGIANGEKILAAAERRSHRFIGFDMDEAAHAAGSAISAVMFGALAGSEVLPFAREQYEAAIRASDKAVAANLSGFAQGLDHARERQALITAAEGPPTPTTAAGAALAVRIRRKLPYAAHAFALEGVRRLMDYQDRDYAALYLSRLERIAAIDTGLEAHALTHEAARHLALWMAYDDTVRVADLKIRTSRFARVEREVGVAPGQLVRVTEYMHPRLQEVCETLPSSIGRAVQRRAWLARRLAPLFARGRHVEVTRLRWFIALWLIAGLRRWRRHSLRFNEEQARIAAWLALVEDTAARDPALAVEIVRAQRLIKGYGDTFERGMHRFDAVLAAAKAGSGRPATAARVRHLCSVALQDESGRDFATALGEEAAA